ncbi:hypothetical protein FI667_g5213, partial [Globisporangium splendens]
MGIKKIVTLETCAVTGERLNSPRSIEACRRAGVEPDELLPKYLHTTLDCVLTLLSLFSRSLCCTQIRTVSEFLVRHASKDSTLIEKEAAPDQQVGQDRGNIVRTLTSAFSREFYPALPLGC